MQNLKLVCWNMEWLNDLFVEDSQAPAFKADQDKPAHGHGDITVADRRRDLAGVINELAPDILVVVEGPSRAEELKLFFDQPALQGDWVTALQPNKSSAQNVGVAVRVDQGKFNNPPLKWFDTTSDNRFDPFSDDIDDDEILEQYKFERRPLHVELYPKDGKAFQLLGLHLKSKMISQAYEWSKWWQIDEANRRKILAQATHIRQKFVEQVLADPEAHLIICGDINDGPGLDASEKRLFASGVERLMGNIWKPELCLRNALFDSLTPGDQEKLNFKKIETTSFRDPIFNNTWQRDWIDHILYNHKKDSNWVTGGKVHEKLAGGVPIWKKYKAASDHFPISVNIGL
jgi:endonuclease/exonuclease/phosphatase family metal-dependent hydrolase